MNHNKFKATLFILILILFRIGTAFSQTSNATDDAVKAKNLNTIFSNTASTQTLIPPQIRYQTPQTYYRNSYIVPLTPINTGGAVPPTVYGVTTYAGSGAAGSANGVALSANFNNPHDVAVDATGNVYVADYGNNSIRMITPGGIVSTIAGTGAFGNTNGAGSAATFDQPSSLTIDADGNLYVGDSGNNLIRKITPGDMVSTFAGAQNGAFRGPTGIVFDKAGNMFVADGNGSLIRKIDKTGVVTTFAGTPNSNIGSVDGSGAAAGFSSAQRLAIDANDNIYATDVYLIRMISPAAQVTTIAGSGLQGRSNGTGSAASFNMPNGIAADIYGNVYIADTFNSLIRKLSPATVVTTLTGGTTNGAVNGTLATATFSYPDGMAIGSLGEIYVADGSNNMIRKIVSTGYTIDQPLPAGLLFDPKTGIISGTPTVTSPATVYHITAYNAAGSDITTVTIEVDEATINYGSLPVKTVCDNIDFSPGATGTLPVNYTSSNTAVATIIANKIHITGPGTAAIVATDGVSNATQMLTISPAVTPSITITPASIDTCVGAVATFTVSNTINGGNNPIYQWQVNGQNTGNTGTTFSSAGLNDNDKITCILTSNASCTLTNTVVSNTVSFIIDAPISLAVNISSSVPGSICIGLPVTFTATTSSSYTNVIYQWQVNNNNAGTNNAIFTVSSLNEGDVVTCTITSNNKCLVSPNAVSNAITISVSPKDVCSIVIPNTFTPNGDGINDLWDIAALASYPNCVVSIYNRNGALVYTSIGYSKSWNGTYNGKPLPLGTYYYTINLKNGLNPLSGYIVIVK